MKFYKCNKCGQVIAKVLDTNVPVICCGEEMSEIQPKCEEENFTEKHLPDYEIKDNKLIVKIGSKEHPMDLNHHICWIYIQTNKGNQRKILYPGESPRAIFCLDKDEKVLSIYSYCNIHSLWVKKLDNDEDCRD